LNFSLGQPSRLVQVASCDAPIPFDLSQGNHIRSVRYFHQNEEIAMTLIDAIILTAICIGFVGFAVVLAWGDYQTANLKVSTA
jgi:multisubunit Na+/H+ antiporter MnhC subunit